MKFSEKAHVQLCNVHPLITLNLRKSMCYQQLKLI